MKTWKLDYDANHIIINPNTDDEEDITESREECNYCIYKYPECSSTHPYSFCDTFTIKDEYKEVEE